MSLLRTAIFLFLLSSIASAQAVLAGFDSLPSGNKAGDAALLSLAPSDALRYYGDALRLWPSLSESQTVLRLDLTIALGTDL